MEPNAKTIRKFR